MEYWIFISIVDISANLKIIDIDETILKNIEIDIAKEVLENIDIDNLENIDIDIDEEIWEKININKISNQLEFDISNRATRVR